MGVTPLAEAARQRPPRGVEADPQAATQVNPRVASLLMRLPPGGGEEEAPSLFDIGEGWYAPLRDRRLGVPLEGYGSRVWPILPQGPEVEAERLPGVTGVACGQGVRGEAWETQDAFPSRGGNRVQRGMRVLGVGWARSSDDGEDSITPPERRGPASIAPVGKEGRSAFPWGVPSAR